MEITQRDEIIKTTIYDLDVAYEKENERAVKFQERMIEMIENPSKGGKKLVCDNSYEELKRKPGVLTKVVG